MFKNWRSLFSKGKEQTEIQVKIEKDERKTTILDLVEKKRESEDLTNDLMNGIRKFREETHSLDYLRNEIESVMSQKKGEDKLMEGFIQSMNPKKKKN